MFVRCEKESEVESVFRSNDVIIMCMIGKLLIRHRHKKQKERNMQKQSKNSNLIGLDALHVHLPQQHAHRLHVGALVEIVASLPMCECVCVCVRWC